MAQPLNRPGQQPVHYLISEAEWKSVIAQQRQLLRFRRWLLIIASLALLGWVMVIAVFGFNLCRT